MSDRTPTEPLPAPGWGVAPEPRRRTAPGRATRWQSWLIGLGVVLSPLSGLLIGAFLVWFQLFGDTADAGDYQAAAGAYAASAAVLLLGVVASLLLRSPRWQAAVAALGAVGLTLLTGLSLAQAATAEAGSEYVSWTDGAGGALSCPWTWPLVLLGGYALVRRLPLRGANPETTTPVSG